MAEAIVSHIDDVGLWLAPGSSAVILGPADVLTGALHPYSAAERARAAILTSGVVEAIVRLPGGLIPFRPGYETALWVLAPGGDPRLRGSLLLADISDLELTDGLVDALVADVTTWRRGGYDPRAHTRAFSAQVQVGDLASKPGPLTVRRSPSIYEFHAAAAARVARVTQLESEQIRIGAEAMAARRPALSGAVAGHVPRLAHETIGSLVRSMRLVLRQGSRIGRGDLGTSGQHQVIGVPELLGQRGYGDRAIDRVTLADRYPRALLTEPGDLVITTVPRLSMTIDRDGFSAVEYPARVLRIPQNERGQLTPAVLGALLAADDHGGRAGGAVRSRQLQERHIPLLSPAEVRRLDALLERLDSQIAVAQREIDVLTEMREIMAAGLMDGTLALTSDAGTN